MTDLRKAAEMALEALEGCRIEYDYFGNPMNESDVDVIKAIEALRTALAQTEPKLIGWRTDNYLLETSDKRMAENWEVHYKILPIFEGDPHTKLAQTDQEYFCDTHCVHTDHHPDCELAQPEQEPWLWIRKNYSQGAWISNRLPKDPENWDAVYKEPPKREWVGLTDDEIYEIEEDSKDFDYLIPHLFARSIEAKLKEKNT